MLALIFVVFFYLWYICKNSWNMFDEFLWLTLDNNTEFKVKILVVICWVYVRWADRFQNVCILWLLHSRHGPFGVSVMLRIDELNSSMCRFLASACWDLLATTKRAHEIKVQRRWKKRREGISVLQFQEPKGHNDWKWVSCGSFVQLLWD